MTIATLLVSGPDRPGLVAALAQVLYGHGANILDADQHSDPEAGWFFQRIRFDQRELRTDRTSLHHAIGEVSERLGMTWKLDASERKKKVAIFVSKYDHCLFDLLWRHRAGELPCEVALVVSNHSDLGPVAAQFGIPFHAFPVTKETKAQEEAKQLALLAEHRIELVVLARYMQILSAELIQQFSGAIINIHHSFLPAFVGQRPYHRARERGVKLVGATAHYVTADLDEGPIIEQDVTRCSHRDTVDELVRKGRDLEKVVLARAVRLHLQDRILVYQNKTVVFE